MNIETSSKVITWHRLGKISLTAWLSILAGLCCLHGCATPEPVRVFPNREAAIGKTTENLVQCAGQPLRQEVQGNKTLFLYYKEAPMLQESFPASKGSFPKPHHGCWAKVVLEEGRVTGIGYQSDPDTFDALSQCEAIFAACTSY